MNGVIRITYKTLIVSENLNVFVTILHGNKNTRQQ